MDLNNKMVDKLDKIFELQKEFQQLLKIDIPLHKFDVLLKRNIELIKNQILALFDEISEALREVPWKPWKENQYFNVIKFQIELIDVFHFLVNLFLLSGMNAEYTYILFLRKNAINRRRQKNGY